MNDKDAPSFSTILSSALEICTIPQINGFECTWFQGLPKNFQLVQNLSIQPRVFPYSIIEHSNEELNPGSYRASLNGTVFGFPLSLSFSNRQLFLNIQKKIRNVLTAALDTSVSVNPESHAQIIFSNPFVNISGMFSFSQMSRYNFDLDFGTHFKNIMFGSNFHFDPQIQKLFSPISSTIAMNYTYTPKIKAIKSFYSRHKIHNNSTSFIFNIKDSLTFSIEKDVHIGSSTSIGTNIKVNMSTLESETRVGFQRQYKLTTFSAVIENTGKISSILQRNVKPGFSLSISSYADLVHSVYVMGLGVTIVN